MIMATVKDGATEVHVRRYIDVALKSEEAVSMLPVGEVRAKGKRNKAIQGLESLESEGIRGRGRGNA